MAAQTGEWWKKPAPTPWYQQKPATPWYKQIAPAKSTPAAASSKPQNYVEISPEARAQVQAEWDANHPASPAQAAASAASIKAAADAAKKNDLKGRGNKTLDEMMALYDQLKGLVSKVGKDQTNRLNGQYDDKVNQQIDAMNQGQYETDAAAAAGNLASSSYRSFDRGKVQKASEDNRKVLNESRATDLAKVGQMVSEDTAKYQSDQNGIGLTRDLLGKSDNVDELTSTVSNLDATKRGAEAATGKYGTQGEFVAKANSLGNYDTTTLEKTLQSVVANASATPATKAATMDDLLNGTSLSADKKNELKNKYTQVVQ